MRSSTFPRAASGSPATVVVPMEPGLRAGKAQPFDSRRSPAGVGLGHVGGVPGRHTQWISASGLGWPHRARWRVVRSRTPDGDRLSRAGTFPDSGRCTRDQPCGSFNEPGARGPGADPARSEQPRSHGDTPRAPCRSGEGRSRVCTTAMCWWSGSVPRPAPLGRSDGATRETFIRCVPQTRRMVQDARVRSWLYAIAAARVRRASAQRPPSATTTRQRSGNLAERTGVVDAAPHQPDMAEAVAGFPSWHRPTAQRTTGRALPGSSSNCSDDERLPCTCTTSNRPDRRGLGCLGVSRNRFYKLLTRGRALSLPMTGPA